MASRLILNAAEVDGLVYMLTPLSHSSGVKEGNSLRVFRWERFRKDGSVTSRIEVTRYRGLTDEDGGRIVIVWKSEAGKRTRLEEYKDLQMMRTVYAFVSVHGPRADQGPRPSSDWPFLKPKTSESE